MDNIIILFILNMQSIPPEILMILEITVCIIVLLFFLRYFGLFGIMSSAIIMLIAANIQILKLAYFDWMHVKVALGSVAFTSVYLISDIITELYGKNIARKVVYVTALSQLFFVILMIITLGYKILDDNLIHKSIENIFVPQVRILLVSLFSYVLSQLIDIAIFTSIAEIMKDRFLWLRVNLSGFLSQIFDSILFNILCWKIFSSNPRGILEIMTIYVSFSFVPRFIISIIATPTVYLAKHMKKDDVFF